MIAVRSVVQVALIAACAAVGLVAIQVYMSSKAETIPHAVTASKADATASKRIKDNDLEASRPMGPIYPTIKYTAAQLAVPSVTKPVRIQSQRLAKSKQHLPLQIAYVPTIAAAYIH